MHKVIDRKDKMKEFEEKVQAFLDTMTQEEFDQILDELGNSTGKPGPMFKSREDVERQESRKSLKNMVLAEADELIAEPGFFSLF
ncbi:MAG: hypothetical protein FWE54_00595 [Methanimicrococcus sp.]|nr:hypothetical protein [Methanimicrococcus sp.]